MFSLRFLPAAIRAPFIPFQSGCLSCCPARQNRSVSHARFIIDNIRFHLLYYSILSLYLSSCNPYQIFCFFRHDLRSNVMFAQSFLRFFVSASRQQIISFPHAFYPLILFFRRFFFVLFPAYALGCITALSSTFFRSLKKPRISSFQRDSKAVSRLSGSSSSMFCPNFSGTSIKPIL